MSSRTHMSTRAWPGAMDSRRMPMAWLALSRAKSSLAQAAAREKSSRLVTEEPSFGHQAAQ